MQKLLQLFILTIFLAGLSTIAIRPPVAQAADSCSITGKKIGNNYIFTISSPNFTSDSGADLPRISVGSYVTFNGHDNFKTGANINWSDAGASYNDYNQSWSFTLTDKMPGYTEVQANAQYGLSLDGRMGDIDCGEVDEYNFTYTAPTGQCFTTTADVYTSPACQDERLAEQAAWAARDCQNHTGSIKETCMKREYCIQTGQPRDCVDNLTNSVLNAIRQAATNTSHQQTLDTINTASNRALQAVARKAKIAEMCAPYTENSQTCLTVASQCLDESSDSNCLDKEMCQYEKGSVYTYLFRDSQGSACFTLGEFIPTLLNYFMMFAAIIAGFIFVWAGYKYLTSRGDPSALADAKDMIMQAVIGLVILALSYVIIQILGSAFSGVDASIMLI